MEYVRSNKPTYMQFERWVVEQNGGHIDPERIRKHNEAVRGYNHANDLASDMRKSCGLTDETISDAVTLNKLEDLDELHHQLTRR
jgi:prophage antirepressor-like protein